MTASVLFVDDDEGNLVVCEAATGDEFNVLTAPDAASALELMKEHEVGVLIADQRMPGTTGVELLERVKEDFPDTIRILITAYSDLPAAIDAINLGQVRRYLRKPWEPDELRAEIRDALDIYDMSRRLGLIEQRLRAAERVYSLGVIAAGIAHELRNPIGWISNNLTLARSELADIATALASDRYNVRAVRQRLDEMSEGLEDAAAGVKRIVDIVQGIEMPIRPSENEIVDLGEVLRLTLRIVHGELKQCAELDVQIGQSLRVRGSSTKLSQVVLNLLVNAIQALAHRPREENRISVSLHKAGSLAQIDVADNGEGLPAENIDRIFDPFFTTKRSGGSGLGLAISKTIAEELGGTIEASNLEEGGALFRFSVPAL